MSHTHTHMHIITHTHTHTHTHTCARTHAHTHTHTHSYTHCYTHTHTHTCSQQLTYRHAFTRKHTLQINTPYKHVTVTLYKRTPLLHCRIHPLSFLPIPTIPFLPFSNTLIHTENTDTPDLCLCWKQSSTCNVHPSPHTPSTGLRHPFFNHCRI